MSPSEVQRTTYIEEVQAELRESLLAADLLQECIKLFGDGWPKATSNNPAIVRNWLKERDEMILLLRRVCNVDRPA